MADDHSTMPSYSQEKTTINEETLVDLVHLHPCLYNSLAEGYKDQATRSKAWENIGDHLNVKGEQAKEAWEKLRRCFMNAIKRRQTKPLHPWRFEQKMSFLFNHIDPSKVITKYNTDDQQHYFEPDERSFDGELNISDSKVENPSNNVPANNRLHYPDIKREESPFELYDPEQSCGSPDVEPFRSRTTIGSSIEDHNLLHEQQSTAYSDVVQPEIAERSTQKIEQNPSNPSDESREAANKRKRHSSSIAAGYHVVNERSLRTVSETDDIELFFLGLAKTTKTLAPIEQARVKLQVSQIVFNAQIASLEQSSRLE